MYSMTTFLIDNTLKWYGRMERREDNNMVLKTTYAHACKWGKKPGGPDEDGSTTHWKT